MAKRIFPLSRVYRLLEPGPVTLVGCVISSRNHTFGLLRACRECVINIPTVELAKAVVSCGNSSGQMK